MPGPGHLVPTVVTHIHTTAQYALLPSPGKLEPRNFAFPFDSEPTAQNIDQLKNLGNVHI